MTQSVSGSMAHEVILNNSPEIREQVAALLSRTTEVVVAAPDTQAVEEIDNPSSPHFHTVVRQASIGGFYTGEGVRIYSGEEDAQVRGTSEILGELAVNTGHVRPIKGARHVYKELVDKMCKTNDRSGEVTTTVQRRAMIADGPATVTVELVQGSADGQLATKYATFTLRRSLPDGTHFIQESIVTQPGPYNGAVTDRDAIVRDSSGLFVHRDEAARVHAATVLPDDPNFSYAQPLGLAECDRLLGE